MARVYGIKRRLTDRGYDEKFIKEVIGNSNLIGIIERMEKLLEPEITHEILDSCGCGGGKEFGDFCKRIGKENAGKSLADKIAHINATSEDYENVTLNEDGTLTSTWSFGEAGKHNCLCSAAVKRNVTVADSAKAGGEVMPLTYCFCCAGSGRRHLQLKLGAELRTKEIVSSPINSGGAEPCRVTFEII
jgi:hypothetical protein